MKALKVVLTGGPCGGKTSAIKYLKKEFSKKGYKIITIPETATFLIDNNIKSFGDDPLSVYEFQRYVISLQLELEKTATLAANSSSQKTIIICDRGIPDVKSFVKDDEYLSLLKEQNLSPIDILDNYDLVLHLKTIASSQKELYTLDNNNARTETVDEAITRDIRTIDAWRLHPNFKIIENEANFLTKVDNIILEINNNLNKKVKQKCIKKD